FMDLEMPEMDGFAAFAKIRDWERRRGASMESPLPIVALTAFASDEYHERCLAHGFDAFLTKPVTRERLLRTVGSLVRSGHGMSDAASGKGRQGYGFRPEEEVPRPGA